MWRATGVQASVPSENPDCLWDAEASADGRAEQAGIAHMVGLVGLEPTTSCSQSRRATKLRHNPCVSQRYSADARLTRPRFVSWTIDTVRR